jgi:hypothetical protein
MTDNSSLVKDFEIQRDQVINKRLSEYKWAKLRLQVAERAMREGKSIGTTIESILRK